MRIFLLSFLFLLANPLMAYNVGKIVKPSFGSANASTENTETAETPRNSYTAKTYSQSRLNPKAQRVQEDAMPAAPQGGEDFSQVLSVPEEQMQELANAGRKTKMAVPKNFAVKPTEVAPSVKKPEERDSKTPQAAPDQQPVIPAEATAALAQMGQLQEMMKGLETGTPGAAGAGGFPDLSALMGGGSKTPAKK